MSQRPAEKVKGDSDSTRATACSKAATPAAIVPGDPETQFASLRPSATTDDDLQMPPKGKKTCEHQIEI